MNKKQNKPGLDEQTFQKLLEAAYVLQQHSRAAPEQKEEEGEEQKAVMDLLSACLRERELAGPSRSQPSEEFPVKVSPPADYTLALAEIVETQHEIQTRHLGLDAAMALITDKAARITHASGACIGILNEKRVQYRCAAGRTALPGETEVPLATAVCKSCVVTGRVIRSEDLNREVQFDAEPCLKRGILSLVAVPIYHDGAIAGALEVYFDKVHGYTEQDIHTCQLLAGLVTGTLGRDAEDKLKKSIVEERSSMLATLEKLQPNLAALADESSKMAVKSDGKEATILEQTCWKCGTKVPAGEQFCGHCGAVLTRDAQTRSVQSKIASAWQLHQISTPDLGRGNHQQPQALSPTESKVDAGMVSGAIVPPHEYSDPFLPRSPASNGLEKATTAAFSQEPEGHNQTDFEGSKREEEGSIKQPSAARSEGDDKVWSSAADTHEFLEKIAGTQKASRWAELWDAHRGDFYLALAVLLVLVAIRWGLWSNHSVAATGHRNDVSPTSKHQPAPSADLSLLDKLLISLGLAEAPEPPPDKGNPDVQVWVDPHTALYYCPGADLYGKTPKGKITTQRNAQLDQFEPASRKPCE